jgi:hypothetical protein
MRILLALPLLAVAACQVTKDDANDSMSVTYNGDVAENGLADVANTAGNIAEDISKDVQQSADKVQNKADGIQADDKPAESNAN